MLELIYFILLIGTFTAFVALTLFKKEMKNKAKYKDFIEDAIDGIENNFASNNLYAHTNTNGISFTKDSNNNLNVISQSKLCGTAVNY